jgi:hypothetical protein
MARRPTLGQTYGSAAHLKTPTTALICVNLRPSAVKFFEPFEPFRGHSLSTLCVLAALREILLWITTSLNAGIVSLLRLG